jgi:ketosteroid isomerase-like protein
MNPEELVVHATDLLLKGDMAAFAALWAEDGVLEFPFAQPGSPQRLDGRAAVQEYLRGYPDLLDVQEMPELVVHRTVDPEVVVVEFTVNGVVVPTAKPYVMRYIAVITVRGGEIRHYRDYWSPAAAADVMSGTGAMGSALSGNANV